MWKSSRSSSNLCSLPSSDPASSRASFAIVSNSRKIISSYEIALVALVVGASGDGFLRRRSTSDEKRDEPDCASSGRNARSRVRRTSLHATSASNSVMR